MTNAGLKTLLEILKKYDRTRQLGIKTNGYVQANFFEFILYCLLEPEIPINKQVEKQGFIITIRNLINDVSEDVILITFKELEPLMSANLHDVQIEDLQFGKELREALMPINAEDKIKFEKTVSFYVLDIIGSILMAYEEYLKFTMIEK
jgi:hypothetical protein